MTAQNPISSSLGRWSTKLTPDTIRCEVCPRHCVLRPGQRGFCYVRQNLPTPAPAIVNTTYGYSTGFCIDPVEKKPLNHFFPGSAVLSFGTAGCSLGCRFCQNWQTTYARSVTEQSPKASPSAIALAAEKNGCRCVAFTYNEPSIWAEYAVDTAIACHERGIATIAVTSGYITGQARKELYAQIDAANIDLKGFTEAFYRRLCLGQLAPVLDTLAYVRHNTKVWLELTTLIIPGHNDNSQDIKAMCQWIVSVLGPQTPLHFSAFHPAYRLTSPPATTLEALLLVRQIALDNGLQHVYVGNVNAPKEQSTYCSQCGQLLIERDWYRLGTWSLQEGLCSKCHYPLAGHFDAQPGHWSGRRPICHPSS